MRSKDKGQDGVRAFIMDCRAFSWMVSTGRADEEAKPLKWPHYDSSLHMQALMHSHNANNKSTYPANPQEHLKADAQEGD